MGWGDEVMVTGEVKRRHDDSNRKIAVLDRYNQPRWHLAFDHNPRIARPGQRYDLSIKNCGGHRPYLEKLSPERFWFKEYGPPAGEFFFIPSELALGKRAEGKVIVHPNLKQNASPNKDWGFERFEELVLARKDVRWLQIGEFDSRRLPGVEFMETKNHRVAAAALALCRGAVLNEGGLHHSAAAVGRKAVVIFGGFISPKVTGYDLHRNLFVADDKYPLGCGQRLRCGHCERAMESITVERVSGELDAILKR